MGDHAYVAIGDKKRRAAASAITLSAVSLVVDEETRLGGKGIQIPCVLRAGSRPRFEPTIREAPARWRDPRVSGYIHF